MTMLVCLPHCNRAIIVAAFYIVAMFLAAVDDRRAVFRLASAATIPASAIGEDTCSYQCIDGKCTTLAELMLAFGSEHT